MSSKYVPLAATKCKTVFININIVIINSKYKCKYHKYKCKYYKYKRKKYNINVNIVNVNVNATWWLLKRYIFYLVGIFDVTYFYCFWLQ